MTFKEAIIKVLTEAGKPLMAPSAHQANDKPPPLAYIPAL